MTETRISVDVDGSSLSERLSQLSTAYVGRPTFRRQPDMSSHVSHHVILDALSPMSWNFRRLPALVISKSTALLLVLSHSTFLRVTGVLRVSQAAFQ
jgi:hypothetical protein